MVCRPRRRGRLTRREVILIIMIIVVVVVLVVVLGRRRPRRVWRRPERRSAAPGGSDRFRNNSSRIGRGSTAARTRPDHGHAGRTETTAVMGGGRGTPSVVAAEDGLVPLRDLGDLRAEAHVCPVSQSVNCYFTFFLVWVWRRSNGPTVVPTSRELRALMERSGLTLPMKRAALPLVRCASYKLPPNC